MGHNGPWKITQNSFWSQALSLIELRTTAANANMFILTCDIQIKSLYKEELLILSSAQIAYAKESCGCLSSQLLEDQEHPGDYMFLGRWSRRRELLTYVESDECQTFMRRLSEMISHATSIEVHSIELTEETGLERDKKSASENVVASP